MTIFSRIASRSLFYQKKRYISLFVMGLIGMTVTFLCSGLQNGMINALRHKARIYYGGDVQFIGGPGSLSFDSTAPFIEKLQPLFPDAMITERITEAADTMALYFEGNGVRQRAAHGVHFDQERSLFSLLSFSEGGLPLEGEERDSILLSRPIADMLECRVGDYITMLSSTAQGYTNTVSLKVAGIFLDTSLFGMYTAYLDIDMFRELEGRSSTWANRICVYSASGISQSAIASAQRALEKEYPMFPLVSDKDEFYDVIYAPDFDASQELYALIKLDANLREIKMLIQAVVVLVLIIFCILLAIISVGIGSTYRIIVAKRTSEIGTYMSLGMKISSIYLVFLTEVVFLLVLSFAAGGILTAIFSYVLQFFDLSFIPAFDLFLENGRLVPAYSLVQLLAIMIIVVTATLVSVLYSIHRSVHISPVQALRAIN